VRLRIRFFFSLFLFWLFVNLFSKLLFILFHFKQLLSAEFYAFPGIFWYGMKLDLSASAYLMAIPALIMILTTTIQGKFVKVFFHGYVLLILTILGLLLVVDLELYSFWGFRLDRTPLLYIAHPDLMVASVSVFIIIRQILIAILFVTGFYLLYKKFLAPLVAGFKAEKWYLTPVFIILLGLLIIPVRGGFGIAPVNVGTAYFHHKPFLNHAAINVYWNLGYSLSKMKSTRNPYRYMSDEEAGNVSDSLVAPGKEAPGLVNHPKPNIVFIILESFAARIIEPLGGMKDVTPSINKLAAKGLLFENMYASGDRTDKGLVAIMSGYPAQPNQSVIKLPQKTQSLPNIGRILLDKGYQTLFCYGGDADFANMRSFLTNSGFRKLVSLKDFDRSMNTSKWGVHDQFVFDRFLTELEKLPEPFFSIILTQSSHEPFDVPHRSKFSGTNDDARFLNSAHYVDSLIGIFMEQASVQNWYRNTLFVFISDHSTRLPGNLSIHEAPRFHIPMLWYGDILEETPARISRFGSQTDLSKTLLNQLGYDARDFVFSKDLLDEGGTSNAFYVFNDGFGFLNDSAWVTFDNRAKKLIAESGSSEAAGNALKSGKAFLQHSFQDYLNR
jgi:phosphoglycerol transferase MdoB-like AlkP superfamily enzyme